MGNAMLDSSKGDGRPCGQNARSQGHPGSNGACNKIHDDECIPAILGATCGTGAAQRQRAPGSEYFGNLPCAPPPSSSSGDAKIDEGAYDSVSRKLGNAGVATLFWASAPSSVFAGGARPHRVRRHRTLVLMAAATAAMLRNALSERHARVFLVTPRCRLPHVDRLPVGLDVLRSHRQARTARPFLGDVILFIHVVPFMAAVALRPHRPRKTARSCSTP